MIFASIAVLVVLAVVARETRLRRQHNRACHLMLDQLLCRERSDAPVVAGAPSNQ